MDTSETYIKQCKEATEIQEQWEASDGDWWHECSNAKCTEYRRSEPRTLVYYGDMTVHRGDVWLPRQDQLQEKVNFKVSAGWLFLDSFIREYITEVNESCDFPDWDSCSQLWLAFVMKKKYHKVWTGNNWVKE